MDSPAKELTERFEEKWRSLQVSADTAQISFPKSNKLCAEARQVFVFSDFVASNCIRDPGLLADLFESGDLHTDYASDVYARKLEPLLADVQDQKQLEKTLRNFRRREMVRIAWRDLSGAADLFETTSELSNFADACIDYTLSLLHRWQCTIYGCPTGGDNADQQLAIIGMGKLGGRELNFSSDVDLIFAYPESGMTTGAAKQISNEDFFARLCRRLLQVLGKATEDGFVFRVDLRLRPYGESGPLSMGFDAMEEYYQLQGREWERYAWIKARAVAGDKSAGKKLLERLNPFVYRRYLDFGAFESLRAMKHKISLEIKRKAMADDIKLGRGGIREIEFFGQIFQLIRGGIVPPLQQRSILNVLKILANEKYIPQRVCDQLSASYIFLRNLEHRLQEYADQQTHQLPSSTDDWIRLALSMGFENKEEFIRRLEDHRSIVHSHFTMLLETKDAKQAPGGRSAELEEIWQGALPSGRGEKILSAAGYRDPAGAVRLLTHLREDLAGRSLGREGRDRLNKLIPLLLEAAGNCDEPLITLNRIVDLIKAIEGRAAYLALLLENPSCLVHLVKLTSASSLIATFLARHPVLLDELLDPRTLYAPPDRNDLEKELRLRLKRLSEDFEYQMEELRVFKQVNVLRVAAADVTQVLPLMRVSDHLSDIAEVVLNEVLELAWDYLTAKHGKPTCKLNSGEPCERGFAVIAYGKLGGLELGYGSDLDLVFLHSGSSGQTDSNHHPIDNNHFFARLGQRVLHLLTAATRAGILYDTDMRLRPSGSSGILVSHIEGFRDYQLNDAWTWEHQALIRSRTVGGDIRLKQEFEDIRRQILALPRNRQKLHQEVVQMRRRMRRELLKPEPGIFHLKQDTGGIVDIEFLVQYLVLLKSHEFPALLEWTDNVRLIQTLIETGVIDEYRAHLLKHAYLIYRAMAHKLNLQEKPARVPEEKFQNLRRKVAEIWNSYFGSA